MTDAGLRALADFESVKTIILTKKNATATGVKQLNDMWPQVKVVR